MKFRTLFLALLLLVSASGSLLRAQTIVELKRGGTVRAKTVDDYKLDDHIQLRAQKDSLQYVDNLRRAFNALHRDSLAEAEQLFNDALRLRPSAPGNQVIRYNLGLVDMARGNNVEAVKKLTHIIKEYPNYFDARVARAEANLQLGYAAEAAADAQLVVDNQGQQDMSPAMLERARFVRAAARYELRLYPDAHADLQTVLRDSPQNENAQLLDALCLNHMGQPREALNRLNLIVSANPESVDALSTRATVEAALEMYALARADYDRLIALQPQESAYYIERAKQLIRLGEKKLARNDLEKAMKLGVPQGMVHPLLQQTR